MKKQSLILLLLSLMLPFAASAFVQKTTYLACDSAASPVNMIIRIGYVAGESTNFGLELYQFDKQTRKPAGLMDSVVGRMKAGEPQVMGLFTTRGQLIGMLKQTGPETFLYQDRRQTFVCLPSVSK